MSPQGTWQDPPEYRGGGGGVQLTFPPLERACKFLLIANFAVFAACWLLSLVSPAALASGYDVLGNNPSMWIDWFPLVPLWQLVTCMFLHGGAWHVIGNMLGLYFLGGMVEATIGSRRFLTLYFAAGLVASIGSLLLRGVLGDPGPSIGASGAVYAAMVAAATMFPHRRIIVFIFPLKLWVFATILIVMNSMTAITALAGRGDSMDDIWAHLFGAGFGYAAVKLGWVWRDPMALLQARREAKQARKTSVDSRRLDELLARIHREGIGSLTRSEKAFLKRSSKRK